MRKPSMKAARFLVMALVFAASIASADEGKLIYGLVPNAPPTTYVDAAGKPTGYFVELYGRIMDELGIPYEFRVADFPAIYPQLISGEVDFFTTLQKTAEREGLFIFPDKGVAAGWGQLFVAVGTEFQSVLELQHKRLGMVKDDRNGVNFKAYMESLAIPFEAVEYPDFNSLVEAVQTGKVFGGVQSNWFVAVEKRVAPTTVVFAPFRSFPVVSRKSAHIADFNRMIARYTELVDDPHSWYYDLQAKWLGLERTETTVVPVWLIGGLVALFLAAFLCFVVIQVLTRKLRFLNRNLERQVAERSALLVKSEKFTALGSLVAGIAHELNTPLQALAMSVETMAESVEEGPGHRRDPLPSQDWVGLGKLLNARARGRKAENADSRAQKRDLLSHLEGLGEPVDARVLELCLDLGIGEPDLGTLEILSGASAPLIEAARAETHRIEALEIMSAAAGQMSQVIKALRIYSHQDKGDEASVVSLRVQLDSALALFSTRLKSGIDVERDYDRLPEYRCYPDQLLQVWLNLIGNALDSMGERGRLVVRGVCLGGELRISVEDSGSGIPAEAKDRVFEPFFTTKPLGKGTGLGLSISREIVSTHGGTIGFTSGPGGTVFTVTLPGHAAVPPALAGTATECGDG